MFGRSALTVTALVALMALVGVCPSEARAGGEEQHRRFLVLYSSHSALAANLEVTGGIKRVFDAALTPEYEVYAEYRDAERFPGADADRRFAEEIYTKYGDLRLDAIIALGPQALAFARDHRDGFAPAAPVIFGGVTSASLEALHLGDGFHGVVGAFDVVGTLALARALQPEARRVVVLTGSAPFDATWKARAEEAFARIEGVAFDYVSGLTLQGFEEFAAGLDHDTILIVLTIFEDAAGRRFIPRNAAAEIAERSSAPVYGVYNTYVGNGMVGGAFATFDSIGVAVAELALRVLDGGAGASEILFAPATPVVDWRQMERFGLDVELLPTSAERDDGFRSGRAAGRQPQLHRPRRHPADAGMGLDDLGRREVLLSLVDRLRAGHGDPAGGARLQLRGRRSARPARPADRLTVSRPPLLQVRGLRVGFRTPAGELEPVGGVDFDIADREVLGIVGESGSGKSVAMKALMRLLPPRARISGSIRFRGRDLVQAGEREMRRLRGGRIAMIFQDPLTAFNPVLTVGEQIGEMLWLHDRSLSRAKLRARTVELLELVSIPEPHRRAGAYPHEFSGGMRQRAMIAMALANDPELLIADEPTTALDVTVQAQILEVLRELQGRLGIGLALVTHDLGVVAGMAERVAVMYAGRIVEQAPVDDLFAHPRHPYTRGLIGAVPRLDRKSGALASIEGSPPSLSQRPSGCPFAPRCPARTGICSTILPPLRQVGASLAACHHAEALPARQPATAPT